MKKIAKFEKISFEIFRKDLLKIFPEYRDNDNHIREMYNSIQLPKRATIGSAGYDFCSPLGLLLRPGETVTIPTGIRVKMKEGWLLQIYPRSSMGFQYRAQLDNTVGIVDQDYYYAENEGHILLKITNDSKENKSMVISYLDRVVQGIFVKFGITFDDDDDEKSTRSGGLGSTGKNQRAAL